MFAGSTPALGTNGSVGNWQTILARAPTRSVGRRDAVGSSPTWATAEEQCPRGAAWSARHPVKVEAVGSNPIGDAYLARYANWQSDEVQTFVTVCGFDSHPCYLHKAQWTSGCGRHALNVEIAGSNAAWVTRRVGVHWRAKLVVTQRSSDCGGSTPSRPTRNNIAKWWNGRHATLRMSCHLWRGSSTLPLATTNISAGEPVLSGAS